MIRLFIILGLLLIHSGSSFSEVVSVESNIKNSELLVFKENGEFGIKDSQNNILVKPEFNKIIRLGTTSWIVQKGNKFGLIDSNGSYLIKPKYRHVERIKGQYVKLGNENDFGIYDEKGIAIIAPNYSVIEPLYGEKYLTCKNYKYGVVNFDGTVLIENVLDDIYMPNFDTLRVLYQGQWYDIQQIEDNDVELPENVKKIVIDDKEFKVTQLVAHTSLFSGYSLVTTADYLLKAISSISPAYEDTIDDLMLSQGADTVTIFMKLSWIPKFPFTYAKKYYQTLRNPNNGPLSGVKNTIKRKIND